MRAAIFIDGAHLLKQVGETGVTPDYSRLADYLLTPLRRAVHIDLLRCYFYYAPPWMSAKPTDSELRRKADFDKFAASLEDVDRWQVRLGKLERRRDGDRDVLVQKRVDVLLSVDMVRHAAAGHIQHAVLLAGDSDFIPAVQAVKESGVTITLWAAPDKSAHLDLIRACDEVQTLKWREFPQTSPPPEKAAKPASVDEKVPKTRPVVLPAIAATSSMQTESTLEDATLVAHEGDAPAKKRRRRGGRGRGKRSEEVPPTLQPVPVDVAVPPAPESTAEAAPVAKKRRRRGGRGRGKKPVES